MEVRCIAFGASEPASFDIPEHHIPFVSKYSKRMNFKYAKPDPAMFDKAFRGGRCHPYLLAVRSGTEGA